MSNLVNITSKGKTISLEARRYRIYILGGWGISLGDFSISLEQKETKRIIICERAFWPVQAFALGKRARRIFVLDIKESSLYEVIFGNSEDLKVKRSNLPISSSFGSPKRADQLEVLFTEKLGVYPILE